MKHIKKIACAMLALMMVFALAVPAFAAETTTPTTSVKFPANTNRTFDGYQLLYGSVSADGKNFAYTVNPKYESILKTALGLGSDATSEQIVAKIGTYTDKSAAIQQLANDIYKAILNANLTPDENDFAPTATNSNTVSLTQGYWLFADVTTLGESDLAYVVVLDTVGSSELTITLKPGEITTEKKLDDENDSIMKETGMNDHEDDEVWQDIGDYDIGDSVPFRIHTTLPANTAYFPYYAILMSDTVSAGLTFNDDFKIYVDGTEKTIAQKPTTGTSNADFLYEYSTDGKTVYIYPNHGYTLNAGGAATAGTTYGGDVLPLFASKKNDDNYVDEVGGAEITVRYTCTLNTSAKIGLEGNPNDYTLKFTNSPYADSFGTLKDKVLVLTYQYVVNKTNEDGNALTGADFELYKFIPVTTADTAPEAQPADTTGLLNLAAEGETAQYYYQHPYTSQWGVYKVVTKSIDTAVTTFTFKGLDDGFYRLVETETPEGYNGLTGNTEFRIWANHATVLDGTGTIFGAADGSDFQFRVPSTTVLSGTENDTGIITSDIVNKTGTELPTTGGMGTTLFYVLGTILVLGAAVLLITNKRMGAAK